VAFVALELLNDPYEGVILSLPYTGAGTTRIWQDRPIIKYRVGSMTDYGVNPDYDPDALRKRIKEEKSLNSEVEARRVKAINAIKSCRILSLTRTPDNMVMWAHYADNSKGLCIGIDWAKADLLTPGISASVQTPKAIALTVEYMDRPFESRFEPDKNHIISALGRKHTDWAYEREVRLVRHDSDFARYAPGTNNTVGLLAVPPDAITDIVLGSNPDSTVRSLVKERFKHFPKARVRRLQINSSGYNSRLQEVDDVSSLA
jgi:hypothetical protein